MATRLENPTPLYLDGRGALLDAGYLYLGTAGLDPEIVANRIATFFDAALTIPAAQPIRTLGGVTVNGVAPAQVYFAEADYSLKIRDADLTLVDHIPSVLGALPQYQPLDSDLTAIAALATTAYGRSLLTSVNAAGGRTLLGLGAAALLGDATAAEFRSNVADRALSTDQVWSAAASVPLVPNAGLVIVDMAQGFNFTLAMAGNYTLSAPQNVKPGQSGTIEMKQDTSGGRLILFDAAWKFAGGVDPTLSTAANALDVLSYRVLSDGTVFTGLAKAVS